VDENRIPIDRRDDPVMRTEPADQLRVVPDADLEAADIGLEPEDPEAARAQIEQTRERMSQTIDEIEDALLRKKARIQDRLDILSPIRDNPLPAVGAVFAGGLILGLLTGGGDDEEPELGEAAGLLGAAAAARLRSGRDDAADFWEDRSKRLRKAGRKGRKKLEHLRDRAEERYEDEGGVGGIVETLAASVVSALATLVEEARDRGRDLGHDAAELGEDLYEAVHDEVEDLGDHARRAARRGKDRLRSMR
jgi:ElaB/YqjD/DUF883 family membrane-anchored ribosome-binding protein